MSLAFHSAIKTCHHCFLLFRWCLASLQQAAGLVLADTELMTGLPEYRNGGLLVDMGLLQPKHKEVTEQPHGPEEEVSEA